MTDYITIFTEAAHHASIMPLASEAMIYAMKSFGTEGLPQAVAVAIGGALAGQCFNYAIGHGLMKLPAAPTQRISYLKLKHAFNRYGFILLIFAFAPLCNILVVAAGMFNTPIKKALPTTLAGLIFFYGRLLVS